LTESNDDGNGVLVAGIEHLFGCQVLGIHRYLADVDIKVPERTSPQHTCTGQQTILGELSRSRHLLLADVLSNAI
jgi:hypothetical protein